MVSPLEDVLRRTADAATRYGAPEEMVASAAGSLTPLPCVERVHLEMDALLDNVLHLADVHAGPHEDCDTCHALVGTLAVAMGIVRAEAIVELERKLGE